MLFARGPVLIVFSYGKALSLLALQLEKPTECCVTAPKVNRDARRGTSRRGGGCVEQSVQKSVTLSGIGGPG